MLWLCGVGEEEAGRGDEKVNEALQKVGLPQVKRPLHHTQSSSTLTQAQPSDKTAAVLPINSTAHSLPLCCACVG